MLCMAYASATTRSTSSLASVHSLSGAPKSQGKPRGFEKFRTGLGPCGAKRTLDHELRQEGRVELARVDARHEVGLVGLHEHVVLDRVHQDVDLRDADLGVTVLSGQEMQVASDVGLPTLPCKHIQQMEPGAENNGHTRICDP